jgi:hypothetical protein
MTITIHDDVVPILLEEAEASSITIEEAANFLLRFAATHKPELAVREAFTKSSDGKALFDYEKFVNKREAGQIDLV